MDFIQVLGIKHRYKGNLGINLKIRIINYYTFESNSEVITLDNISNSLAFKGFEMWHANVEDSWLS